LTLRAAAYYPLEASGEYVASLEPVQGIIQIQTAQDDPQDAQSWRVITEATPIAEGDRIRTGRGGLAYLTFFEGVEVEIRESALVVVSTLLLPTDTDPAFDITVDVLVGSMITDIEAMMDAEDRFEVHTPGATSVVRGTRWWTVVTPDGEAAFAVERGDVLVIPHLRREEIVEAAPAQPSNGQATEEAPMVAAAAPTSTTSELAPGMGVLTDPYGAILDTEADIQFPAETTDGMFSLPLPGPGCGDGICGADEVTACAIDCLDRLTLASCGNGVCETDQGEDLLVCDSDCGPWAGDSCGDGTCQSDESGLTCAADCAPDDYFDPIDPAQCGNAICDATESTLNCPADCASSGAE
jgi:hypothetical protein